MRVFMSPLALFQSAVSPLSNSFSLLLFGVIGTFTSLIATYNTFDVIQDQFKSFGDFEDTFDFIIVGGGSAGSVLANRLSEDYKVLLLEAGGEPNPLHSIPTLSLLLLNLPFVDWQFFTTPQKNGCRAMNNRQCAWPRGKALGGSSNLNFMIYMRGHPYDFDNWANITGDPRWKYENVLPFFKKSEDYTGDWDDGRYHSHGGNLKVSEPPYKGMAEIFVQAGQDFGYPRVDLNAEFQEGFSPIYYTQSNGRRYGTYKAFIEPVRDRRNLFIYKFSHATQILFEGPDNRAYGVEYVRHGYKKVAYATKEVILSAGSLSTPQILMLSGIGPRDHLESFQIPVRVDLPVGQNLQDHVSSLLGPFIVDAPISMRMERDVSAAAVDEFTKYGTGPMSSTGIQASSFLISELAKARGQADWPDIQWLLLGTGVYPRQEVDTSRSFNVRPGIMKKFYEEAKGKDSFQIMNMLSRPFARGQVRLQSRDPLIPLLFDANYFDNADDIKVIVEGAQRAVHLVENSKTFRALGARLMNVSFPECTHVPFRSDAYWECFHRQYSLTVYHQVGTCAMGKPDSPHAVVDSQLRVLGTRNLRVVDASIMPIVPTANTNAPTIMVGEVGSHLIKSTWENINELIK